MRRLQETSVAPQQQETSAMPQRQGAPTTPQGQEKPEGTCGLFYYELSLIASLVGGRFRMLLLYPVKS